MDNEHGLYNNRGYRSFRNSLDLGMGALYIVIGVVILYVKYFGTIELSAGYAYVLGSLMILYGLFRIYRGIVGMGKIRRRN